MYQMHHVLNLDLMHTDMTDFVEHLERTLEQRPQDILTNIPDVALGRFDDTAYEPLSPTQVKELEASRLTIVSLRRTIFGNTTRIYRVEVEQKLAFLLSTIRYRQDRLRIVFEEYFGSFKYAQSFIDWLCPRWGEPVYLLTYQGTPMSRQAPPLMGLTSHEMDVAELIAGGMNDSEIRRELYLDASELQRHRRSLIRKLKIYKPIAQDLKTSDLSHLLRQLGFGGSTSS